MSYVQTLHAANQLADEVFLIHAARVGIGHITPRQAAILAAIGKVMSIAGPGEFPCQTEIGELASMDRSTLTVIMNRLVAAGLVKRTHARHDGRAYALSLTASGAKLLPKIAAARDAADAELSTRIRGLDRLRIVVDSSPRQAPGRLAAE